MDQRARVIGEDEGTGGTTIPLATLWHGLVAGDIVVVDWFHSLTRCYVVVRHVEPAHRRPCRCEAIDALRRTLRGEPQKATAFDTRRSQATVAVRVKDALRCMGLDCNARRVPIVVVMAERAEALGSAAVARATKLSVDGEQSMVVSAERAEGPLTVLSHAERAAVRAVLEGYKNIEIALLDGGKSSRTIANQLASAYRKLRVSSRGELLAGLAVKALEPRPEAIHASNAAEVSP